MFTKYFNTFLSRFSYHNNLVKPVNKPNIFAIETTSVCNLACTMCPYPIMDRAKGFIDETLFKNLVDKEADTSYLMRLHNLGEPLLDKRMPQLINYAAKNKVRVEISTNCTALTEAKAREILSSNLHQIILSLDGASKVTYEHIRKNADFDRVVGHITKFLELKQEMKAKVRVVLQIILMNETVPEVDGFLKRWEPFRKSGAINEFRIKRFSTWAGQVKSIDDLAENQHRYYPAPEEKRVPCLYLWESLVVLQDGRVVPCCFDYEGKMVMGDLNKQSLQEIWLGPVFQKFRENHLKGNFDNDLCRNCKEYPRARHMFFYPFNKAGLHSFWTWIQILLGKKQILETIPVDVTPP